MIKWLKFPPSWFIGLIVGIIVGMSLEYLGLLYLALQTAK